MKGITLEKVDEIRKRTGVSYKIAKEALELNDGDVLEALIYIENNVVVPFAEENDFKDDFNKSENIEEFKTWLKNIIEKGNVTRIKVKKDDTTLVDVPVNAGIAAAVIGVIVPPILAFGLIATVATKLTIEITKSDGSVEVVNKYVEKAAGEVKDKAFEFAEIVKGKLKNTKNNFKDEQINKNKSYKTDDTVYTYTVNFDDEK